MIHSPFDTPIEMGALEAQKVVNRPFALRYRMAYDAHLASDALNDEIFYLTPDQKLMAAAVNGRGSSFEIGIVKPLFQTSARTGAGFGGYSYDVSADGERFLVNTLPEQETSVPITVVVNWQAALNKK